MRGRSSGSFDSMITFDERPVNSSTCSLHGDALDDVAELHVAADLGEDRDGEGIPLGQHGAGLDGSPSATLSGRRRPPGSARARGPRVEITSSPLRFIDQGLPLRVGRPCAGCGSAPRPRWWPRCCSARRCRVAVPPMWKVRIVSWVPGSPIDWAAITPTASPMFTISPRARSRP